MKNSYRIVIDRYAGYEAQVKFWWFPLLWFQLGCINTFPSEEQAEAFIRHSVYKKESYTVKHLRRIYKLLHALYTIAKAYIKLRR